MRMIQDDEKGGGATVVVFDGWHDDEVEVGGYGVEVATSLRSSQ